MEYTHLGWTGLKVSRFCLGTMAFGREADEPISVQIMDRALELGVNFFDTALGAAGQSDLRGQQQFPGLVYRAGPGCRRRAPFHGTDFRIEPL
jgi:predicted aldo/keto reductase-like oxidoreductase